MVFENALEILSDCLNLSESVEALSDLKIICDTSSPDEVNRYFLDKFNYNWEKECIKELEVFGFDAKEAMESNQDPVSTGIRGNEILVHGHLGIRNDYIVFHEYNIDSLEEAFFETKKQFPDIVFEGFVITDCSDEHGGDLHADEFLPDGRLADRKNDLVHSNIGEFLAAAFLDYKNPEEVEWFSEKFGYPILLMDCDYQESESVLWDRLISHNYYYKSKEICDALCFYSSYLSDNILKRAIDHFAEISDEMSERLEDCLNEDI